MLRVLPKAYSSRKEIGINYGLRVIEIGQDLYNRYQSLKAVVPVDLVSELNKIENENQFDLLSYINSFINGTAIHNNAIDDEGYNACLGKLMEIQYFLKSKLDKRGEDLK